MIASHNFEICNFINISEHFYYNFKLYYYDSYLLSLSSYLHNYSINFFYDYTINSLFFTIFEVINTNIFFILSFFFLLLYYSNHGIQLISYNLNSIEFFSDFFSFFSDFDDEIGSVDDIIIYSTFFLSIIIFFFFHTIFNFFNYSSLSWVISVLNFIFFIAILTPIHILYSYGLSFPVFVRGVGRTSSFIFESISDFIAIGVMLSRFLIQNFRLLLIFIAFFELFEVVYLTCDISFYNFINNLFSYNLIKTSFCNFYWYDFISDILVITFQLFFYCAHLIYTFIGQLMNYFLLSFYLFYFLYTNFILDSHEKYFFYKKFTHNIVA